MNGIISRDEKAHVSSVSLGGKCASAFAAIMILIGSPGCKNPPQDTALPGPEAGHSPTAPASTSLPQLPASADYLPAPFAAPHSRPSVAFVHPGLLHTEEDFERMRTKLRDGAEPWTSGFKALTDHGFSQAPFEPHPLTKVLRGGAGQNFGRMVNECQRAYLCALRWKITGDTQYADASVGLLKAWSGTMTELGGNNDRFLAVGIYVYMWANVGEIMRSYPGWKPEEINHFQGWLLEHYYAKSHDFFQRHNGAAITNYWANWDLCNLAGVLSIGVFCDRPDIFQEGLDYLDHGAGNGELRRAIYYLHPGKMGQWQEAGRDQGHGIFGVDMLGAVCEIAWSQGVDLYSAADCRFLAGAEYTAKYNLGHDVPYQAYCWGTGPKGKWGIQPVISSIARGNGGTGYELVYNHYVNRLGIAAPWCEERVLGLRPESNGLYLGCGTLTFAQDPAPSAPPRLSIHEFGGLPRLAWWGSARASGYEVLRAASPAGPFAKIATLGPRDFGYDDADAGKNPANYTYRIRSLFPNGGKSLDSNLAHATTLAEGELLAQWSFDKNRQDAAATLAGGAQLAPGHLGEAVQLDGLTGHVVLSKGIAAELGDFTFAAWVKLNERKNYSPVFDFGDGDGRHFWLLAADGKGLPSFGGTTVYGYNRQEFTGDTPLPVNEWIHVAITLHGRTGVLYVNGAPAGQNDGLDFPPFQFGKTANNYLGRWQSDKGIHLAGSLDEVRLYRGAFSPQAIQFLAANQGKRP